MSDESRYIKYGKLMGGLIHNLNTPLMGCTGRIELLQMKLGEEKNLDQISVQLDKINSTLVSVAYILDKDNSDKIMMIDLKILLDHYFVFLYTDTRFKHQIEKEISLVSQTVSTNPSTLVNYMHTFFGYLLMYIDGASVLEITNATENNVHTIYICMKYDDSINEEVVEPLNNTLSYLSSVVGEDVMKKYITKVDVTDEVKVSISFEDDM